jgi:hypothetical protein
MGESGRYVELIFQLSRKMYAFPPAECGRTRAEIDRRIEDLALDDADQLALRMSLLKVQSPEHSPPRAGFVVLDETRSDSGRREIALAVGLDEVPARVTENPWTDF